MDRVPRSRILLASLVALAIGTGVGTAWVASCVVDDHVLAGDGPPCDRAGLGDIVARLTPARR